MPANTNTAAGSRVKYRSSCDRCQDNKVKCGQEKPECDRCVKKRLVCVYSPIRTMGRPRKAQPGTGTPATTDSNASPRVANPSAQKESSPVEHAPTVATAIITPPQEHYSPDVMQGVEEDHHRISPLSHNIPDPAHDTGSIDPELNIVTPINLDTPVSSNLNYPSSSTGTRTASGGSTNGDASSTTGITAPSITSGPSPPSSCYTSILTRSLKLEQILHSAAGDPIGLEAALEAESDFRALKTQLFNCPGGGHHGENPPKHVTAITGTSFILAPQHSVANSPPCLAALMESRLCLTTLIMYAERVAEVLKDAIADFQPFPGLDSCSTRCSYFGVQNYRVLRAMDFHALRVDGFFLDRGSERVNRLWDLRSVREQLNLASRGGADGETAKSEFEVVTAPERRDPPPAQPTAAEQDDGERGNGYENSNFGSMTPAEGRALRRIFRLRMQKFRGALVDIQRFVSPLSAGSQKQKQTGTVAGQEEEENHDLQMVKQSLAFVEPMVDNLVRRVEVMEQVMAGTLG
ncbi:hypothetical protein V8F06_002823 [Rhypophila decipiens]